MIEKKLGIVVGKIKTKANKHSKWKEATKANTREVPTFNASTKITTHLLSKQTSNYYVGIKY